MAHYKHLTYEERSIIGHYRLRRNVSTISHEIKRNKDTSNYICILEMSNFFGQITNTV